MRKPDLKVVKTPPPSDPRPDLYDYEAEHRRRVASKDWASVHINGDRPSRMVDLHDKPSWKRWFR